MTDRETMKLALDALERSMEAGMTGIKVDQAIAALRQALAEPDMGIDRGAWDDVPDATKWVDELRGGDETEEEEPVGQYSDIVSDGGLDPRNQYDTAPPKREWIGLTEEEMLYLISYQPQPLANRTAIINAVERLLKEKNHAI